MRHFIIHYGEIALKNKNRLFFERALQKRLSSLTSKIAPCKVQRLPGRLLITFAIPPDIQRVSKELKKIFGLVNFIPCGVAAPTLENLKINLGLEIALRKISSFAVRAKRAEKKFPFRSQFINEEIGRFIQEKTEAKVDLEHPETTIHIELLEKQIFYGFEKIPGLGGLPTGVSGKILALLSGGIDSPLAAWRMMKRGCATYFLHFFSAPFTQKESLDKVLDIASVLAEYQGGGILISVPFGEIQRELIAKTREGYRVLLYRRMMLRIAEVLAEKYGCLGLATGESLSQVASQTLSNLATIESVVNLPVFRPLIGMDKVEIVEEAKRIGTFEISIRPHEDCCSFMIPTHPRTHSTSEELNQVEASLEIDKLVQKGVKEAQVYDLN